MDIFPVFDESLPYFTSYLSNSTFLDNLMLNIEKFSALRAIWNFIWPNFV